MKIKDVDKTTYTIKMSPKEAKKLLKALAVLSHSDKISNPLEEIENGLESYYALRVQS